MYLGESNLSPPSHLCATVLNFLIYEWHVTNVTSLLLLLTTWLWSYHEVTLKCRPFLIPKIWLVNFVANNNRVLDCTPSAPPASEKFISALWRGVVVGYILTYMGTTLSWKSSESWLREMLSFWNWTTGIRASNRMNIYSLGMNHLISQEP